MTELSPPQNMSTTKASKSGISVDKILGYLLLLTGILMIVIPVIFIINVFTGRVKPPKVVDVPAPAIALPSLGGNLEIPEQLKSQGFSLKQSNQSAAEQKLIPDDVFNLYINSGFFYLMMLFITSAGAKIANIGIGLAKEIKVKANS